MREAIHRLKHLSISGLLITAMLFVTSCENPAMSNSVQSPRQEQSLARENSALDPPLATVNARQPLRPAWDNDLKFERISVEEGLSQSSVFCIYQDNKGFMWFGTEDGLNKYDGYSFTTYKHDPENPNSLSENYVVSIHEDEVGVLWVRTRSGGINRYDRENEQFIRDQTAPNTRGNVNCNSDWSVYEDQAGVQWTRTDRDGLKRFDPETGQTSHYSHDPDDPHSLSSNFVTSIYEGQASILWIGTIIGGVNKLDHSTDRFVLYRADPNDPLSLSSNIVSSIYEDRTGILWIGTINGLDKLDRERRRVTHYQHDPTDPYSLSHNTVTSIHEDQSGALWIGTDGGGLNKFDRKTERFVHYPSIYNDVSIVYQDQAGILWIGTEGGGLNKLILSETEGSDPETELIVHYRHLPSDPYSLSSDFVFSIYEDEVGVLWVGTIDGGLNKLVPSESEGSDRETERFVRYQNDPGDPNSLSHNWVSSIHEDQKGMLWIGTVGGGLNKLVPSETEGSDRGSEQFTHYREKDGLPNDVVYGILEDEQGNLWLSSNKGLSRFDPRTETFRNYDVSDGLQGNEFNGNAYYKSSNGEMFFGGINGFNAFYPDSIKNNPYIPPVALTSLTQGGEDIDLDKAVESITEVTLKWPDNFFEFEFAALSYAQPGKNQYAYMMEGFEEDWNNIGTRRFGRYTNLPGSTYTLRLKGSNNDGVWNEEGASIEVTIVPPFWATWWFRGIVILVLVGSVIASYRLRVRSVEARARDLEEQVEGRTAELRRETNQRIQAEEALRQSEMEKAITSERGRLARDLHDAVTQTLFSASIIAEVLPKIWQHNPEEGQRRLAELRELTRGSLAEMRTLLLELRPVGIVESDMEELLEQLAESVIGRARIHVSVEIRCDYELPENAKIAMYRIAQESLNNIAKHAKASQVKISLQDDREEVVLSVTDDGIGFDSMNNAPAGLGLRIMGERATDAGVQLTINSQPGLGTEVMAQWPKTSGGEG